MARIFITGGTGCIGASTVQQLLLHEDVEQLLVVTRSNNPRILHLWLGEALDGRIELTAANIGDAKAIQQLLSDFQPTHVIHLGALQSPACDADPRLGMLVNVEGTLNLFQAAAELAAPLKRFVFASSAAVYGKRSMYPDATIREDATLAPPNLYGVWKVAGEHLAALFHQQTGVPVVSLRLNTTFGPGRDQGRTSAPTVALKSIALGAHEGRVIPYRMPYRGRENYHYVQDVGAHFAGAALLPFSGIANFNIKGQTIEVAEFLQIASTVAHEMGIGEYCDLGLVEDAASNLFVCDLEDAAVETTFPGLPRTEIKTGIEKSLSIFRQQAATGTLTLPS
jgi:nucleoside-diphosphate-sugar epimerase